MFSANILKEQRFKICGWEARRVMNPFQITDKIRSKASRAFITPIRLAAMRRHADSFVSAVATAIAAQQYDKLSDAERRELNAIEALRVDLCQSRQQISVPDYGAGEPEQLLSAELMSAGRSTLEIVGEACEKYSKPAHWARLLFQIVRRIKPMSCLELGTCLGLSAAYQAAALKMNGSGVLVTLEGSSAFAEIARRNLCLLGFSSLTSVVVGPFRDTLKGVLNEIKAVDYAFIDGHHDEHATVDYFEQLLPYVAGHAVVILDDTDWSSGMRRAWDRVSKHPHVDVSVDLGKMGLCLLGVEDKAHFRIAVT